jgi:outer membrane protein OmpA-like peptidoglycan-associated protein
MKLKTILFIALFFIAVSPVRAQTTVNSEQAIAPAPGGTPPAVEEKASAPEQAGASQNAVEPAKAAEPQKAAASKKASAPKEEDNLPWWPTDAQPAPVKDTQKGGFWWWPEKPGTVKDLWGNRGYAYVNKIIYDWNGGGGGGVERDVQVRINDIGFPETEDKPSLLVKRTVRSLKLQFKDNAAEIKPEHAAILKKAAETLKRNKGADVLIASNDTPELGLARTQAVKQSLLDQGVAQERIYILAPKKFQEAGLSPKEDSPPGTVQVLVAEVKEVLIPGPKDK